MADFRLRCFSFALIFFMVSCSSSVPIGARTIQADILTSPTKAMIYINGKYHGESPLHADLWYSGANSTTDIIAMPLYPDQYPQALRIEGYQLPNKIYFFMNTPSNEAQKKLEKKKKKLLAAKLLIIKPTVKPLDLPAMIIYFPTDSADLTPQAMQAIDANAAYLQAHPDIQVQLQGHADERGSDDYNQTLAMQRSLVVLDYLVKLGIDANSLHALATGKQNPLYKGHNEAAWRYNRRVEFSQFIKPSKTN